jgi:hypothetical protein
METYISEQDIMIAIKKHRATLSYDDKFDFEIETSKLNLTDKTRDKLNGKQSALEFRLKKYGIHKDKNKAA